MSEETKKAIEELVKATDGNEIAKAFLSGYKSGLDTSKATAKSAQQPTEASQEKNS